VIDIPNTAGVCYNSTSSTSCFYGFDGTSCCASSASCPTLALRGGSCFAPNYPCFSPMNGTNISSFMLGDNVLICWYGAGNKSCVYDDNNGHLLSDNFGHACASNIIPTPTPTPTPTPEPTPTPVPTPTPTPVPTVIVSVTGNSNDAIYNGIYFGALAVAILVILIIVRICSSRSRRHKYALV
jgi:hypothetical protein